VKKEGGFMKKVLISLILLLGIISFYLIFILDQEKEEKLIKVKVAEVTRSIFYAPQYVALGQGFFEEEGLKIDLILTPGADRVMAAVLSGDVDVGFCGPEATIYVYQSGDKDYVKNFAQLTKRDGSFLLSRKKIKDFSLDDLKGKYVIAGRKGGVPQMTFEWVVKEHGLDPNKDLTLDTSVDFAAMQGAFIGGLGDFVTLFEPVALQVENQGFGYVVASVGALGGEVPYTTYSAKKSYIKKNPEIIQSFSNAINKGLKFVDKESSKKIAKSIYKFFPDISMNELIAVIDRYKKQDTWNKDTYLTKDAFNRLQDIMINAGELKKKVPHKDLVDNSFVK